MLYTLFYGIVLLLVFFLIHFFTAMTICVLFFLFDEPPPDGRFLKWPLAFFTCLSAYYLLGFVGLGPPLWLAQLSDDRESSRIVADRAINDQGGPLPIVKAHPAPFHENDSKNAISPIDSAADGQLRWSIWRYAAWTIGGIVALVATFFYGVSQSIVAENLMTRFPLLRRLLQFHQRPEG